MLSLFTYGLTLGAAESGTDTKELSKPPFVFQPSHDIPDFPAESANPRSGSFNLGSELYKQRPKGLMGWIQKVRGF